MSRPATTLCTLATSGLMSLVFAQPVMAQEPTISHVFPTDIPGGARNATQIAAATFAWQEFIALNWPAVEQTGELNTRGVPNVNAALFDPGVNGTLVWETLRSKVEIYPGQGEVGSPLVTPNGYVDYPSLDYGFDGPPRYRYAPGSVGAYPPLLPAGYIVADIEQKSFTVPAFVNLDEDNEIEEDAMFAGIASENPFPGQQFLYVAKASRKEYTYVAGNKWWYGSATTAVKKRTQDYVFLNKKTPPPGSTQYVSFPSGTFEVKSAWRRLTASELKSGRFHTNRVRYYVPQISGGSYGGISGNGNPKYPAWREEVWGMCSLHIIHKTPSAPYFIYATFEQADNILNADGTESVETVSGEVKPAYTGLNPLDPEIVSTPATPTDQQTLKAIGQFFPTKRLYYKNLPAGVKDHPVPRGPIGVVRRIHSIPQPIIDVNKFYQKKIAEYNEEHHTTSPWQYYKLVNVQWKPLTKEIPDNPFGKGHGNPGTPYVGPNVQSYYLSNIVVETDYNLQVFSGKLDNPDPENLDGLITDFYNAVNNNGHPELIRKPANNVPFAGLNYNMGGCMGCHGNIAQLGADFSFIFQGSSVSSPEFKLEYKSLTPP